jgi:nucleoredoxin
MKPSPARLAPVIALVLACLTLAAFQAKPPVETLALRDLVQRPDRWPASVTLKRDLQHPSGATARAGQAVKVVEFNGIQLTVDAGNQLSFEIGPEDCDLLEAANLAWAALTPAQRAIEPKTLIEDASLWPERTVCSGDFLLEDGTTLPAGAEYDFISLDAEGVKMWSKEHGAMLLTDLAQTDVIARARKIALVEPGKRPSRIAAALKTSLVDSGGKPFSSPAIDDARVYVLYFGASWCGPCRKFSPGLVRFATNAAKDHPRLATVLLSNDKKDADMRRYMTEEKMPWPAMPLATLRETPLLMSLSAGYIPHLVVLDRHGKVLASSVENGQYVGPDRALEKLEGLLATGIAR